MKWKKGRHVLRKEERVEGWGGGETPLGLASGQMGRGRTPVFKKTKFQLPELSKSKQ